MEKKWLAVILMLFCTAFTSTAQVFYKFGAAELPAILTNWQLILGLFLYGIGAVIFIIALKMGEVTVLYPIIATSYIWVSLLSWAVFGEAVTALKWMGILAIVIGISVISFGGRASSKGSRKKSKAGRNSE